MEFDSANITHDIHDGTTKDDISKPVQPETVLSGEIKHHSSTDTVQANKSDTCEHGNLVESEDHAGDVMRAGGYGARDDISSFLILPVTDFEASLRDARDYEEPQKDICRPGLGLIGDRRRPTEKSTAEPGESINSNQSRLTQRHNRCSNLNRSKPDSRSTIGIEKRHRES